MKILILFLALILTSCGKENVRQIEGNNYAIISSIDKDYSQSKEDDNLEDSNEDLSSNDVVYTEEEPEIEEDYEDENILNELENVSIYSSKGPSTGTSTLDFSEDGKFEGENRTTHIADKKDFGLVEEAKKLATDEMHYSKYYGKFDIIKKVNENTYRLSLSQFEITSPVGPSKENSFTYNVDFARGLDKNDTYYLFTPEATDEDFLNISPKFKDALDKINYRNEDIGYVIYNKSKNETFGMNIF